MEKEATQIAIIGAGIFVRTQYIPRLAEISELFTLKAIWSRSEESARGAVEIAQKYFPGVVCKWGDKGLDEIIHDDSIIGVAVVLAGQAQVDISLRLLEAGKHVLQEKPAAASTNELETALSSYKSICANLPSQPIWAVAENYRFEPAFLECKKLMADIGDMMSVQVIVEGSMSSSNPYFSSTWRRNFTGGFILDMGVHFIAGLRMLVDSEIVSVSAMTSHVDATLPPPDNISSLFQLENGCSGVFVMVVSSRSPKIFWRVVGFKGTLQIERGNIDGRHGYLVSFYNSDGQSKSSFFTFSGVNDELKTFIHDISLATLKKGSGYEADPRLSYLEGARDVAVLEAMIESGTKQGALVKVKNF
ncbi:dehydrogenase FPY6 [Corylus avellana]|uniref:dehydrogenase FPY6 n=1 Tax=Corylus avellana TaxID=13451 RepID=UPI00286D07C6|nr:dehydrogenase FPY6 [Corylus avellana]